MVASGAASALTMSFSHPYGELVDRGSVTIRVDVTSAWDCTSSTVVDVAGKRITLTGGLSPPGPPLNCLAPWTSVLSPLPAGRYQVTAQVAASTGAVVETATRTIDVLPVEGRCNAAPELVPTMWGVHKSMRPVDLVQKLQGDAAYAGMCELQVLDDNYEKATGSEIDPRQAHGSAYGMVAAARGYQHPIGAWNFEEVTVKGSKIKVELNGTVILDCDLSTVKNFMHDTPHPGKDRTKGNFGFAGHNDPAAFRNISIKAL